MQQDTRTSKQIILDLCNSGEFAEFKEGLKLLNQSIDNYDLEQVVESIISIGRSRDMMLSKINAAFKYKIEKCLTSAQIEEINMESGEEGVSLVYKPDVPSYIKEGIYTSVNSNLITIDFRNKKVYMTDIEKSYNEAQMYSREERNQIKLDLEVRRHEISEMEQNRGSIAYVINKVKKYNENAIKNNTFERIKCLVNKKTSHEYLVMYDEILVEMKEEYEARYEDFAKTKEYNYDSKLLEVRELQKGLMRKLVTLNFVVEYENPQQKMELKKSLLDHLNIYSR